MKEPALKDSIELNLREIVRYFSRGRLVFFFTAGFFLAASVIVFVFNPVKSKFITLLPMAFATESVVQRDNSDRIEDMLFQMILDSSAQREFYQELFRNEGEKGIAATLNQDDYGFKDFFKSFKSANNASNPIYFKKRSARELDFQFTFPLSLGSNVGPALSSAIQKTIKFWSKKNFVEYNFILDEKISASEVSLKMSQKQHSDLLRDLDLKREGIKTEIASIDYNYFSKTLKLKGRDFFYYIRTNKILDSKNGSEPNSFDSNYLSSSLDTHSYLGALRQEGLVGQDEARDAIQKLGNLRYEMKLIGLEIEKSEVDLKNASRQYQSIGELKFSRLKEKDLSIPDVTLNAELFQLYLKSGLVERELSSRNFYLFLISISGVLLGVFFAVLYGRFGLRKVAEKR
ncbi:MAG: hypothetical protein KA436_10145 [Oligoflexales bacterium]|nr:hypothetical protein [Oligoflexales bacterium]